MLQVADSTVCISPGAGYAGSNGARGSFGNGINLAAGNLRAHVVMCGRTRACLYGVGNTYVAIFLKDMNWSRLSVTVKVFMEVSAPSPNYSIKPRFAGC